MARLVVGVNDLVTVRPDLAAELVDQTLITQLTVSSHKRTQWHCTTYDHTYLAAVAARSRGSGCPYCSNNKVLPGFNDLATTHPDLAAELVDQTLATQLSAGSDKKPDWCCKAKGHVWSAVVGSRSAGTGCPYCAGKRAIPGETDLATTHPDLAAELVDQTLARQLTAGSDKKAKWHCTTYDHTYIAAVSARSGGRGCNYCPGRAVLAGFNDLATLRPDLAAELVDQTLATQLTISSHKKVDWCCKAHGHLWSAVVASRSAGRGCPYCAGQLVIAGVNDLATLRPDLAAELIDQTLATQLGVSSHKKVEWCCTAHGHVWSAEVGSRSAGNGCPDCAGQLVLAGFNDLATLRPDLAAELVDQSLATKLGVGTDKKAKWCCKAHGHIWSAAVSSRAIGRGCPECATTGFSQVGIGWLYLLATPGRRVFKFGITNDLDTRLDQHHKQGFTEHVEDLFFEYGGEALAIETALKRHKKAMGWQDGMTRAEMPDGFSETLLADDCGEDFTLTKFRGSL